MVSSNTIVSLLSNHLLLSYQEIQDLLKLEGSPYPMVRLVKNGDIGCIKIKGRYHYFVEAKRDEVLKKFGYESEVRYEEREKIERETQFTNEEESKDIEETFLNKFGYIPVFVDVSFFKRFRQAYRLLRFKKYKYWFSCSFTQSKADYQKHYMKMYIGPYFEKKYRELQFRNKWKAYMKEYMRKKRSEDSNFRLRQNEHSKQWRAKNLLNPVKSAKYLLRQKESWNKYYAKVKSNKIGVKHRVVIDTGFLQGKGEGAL